jgi:hypothetical protein
MSDVCASLMLSNPVQLALSQRYARVMQIPHISFKRHRVLIDLANAGTEERSTVT